MSQNSQGKEQKQQTLLHVGDNLYRSQQSGIYYGIITCNGKYHKFSLETKDKEIARKTLQEKRQAIEKLDTSEASKISFAELDGTGNIIGGLVKQWLDSRTDLLPKVRDSYAGDVKSFAQYFHGQPARNIKTKELGEWAKKRTAETAPTTYNQELGQLRSCFDYAVTEGVRLDNPTKEMKRRRLPKTHPRIPSKAEFLAIVSEVRRLANKSGRGEYSVDLIQALAFSGCRLSEIVGDEKYGYPALLWYGEETNVDFQRGTFTVVGKFRKTRTVPLFPALRECLLRIRARLPKEPKATDRVIPIITADTVLNHACDNLGLPRFSHHDFRHFFASNAIEAGRDFKVIAEWLGHDDGGVLVAKTYGHLRQEHSMASAQYMTFGMTEQQPTDNIVPMPKADTAKPEADEDQPPKIITQAYRTVPRHVAKFLRDMSEAGLPEGIELVDPIGMMSNDLIELDSTGKRIPAPKTKRPMRRCA